MTSQDDDSREAYLETVASLKKLIGLEDEVGSLSQSFVPYIPSRT